MPNTILNSRDTKRPLNGQNSFFPLTERFPLIYFQLEVPPSHTLLGEDLDKPMPVFHRIRLVPVSLPLATGQICFDFNGSSRKNRFRRSTQAEGDVDLSPDVLKRKWAKSPWDENVSTSESVDISRSAPQREVAIIGRSGQGRILTLTLASQGADVNSYSS
ncbi:hypothetical protein RRG08_020830 [Elysia crispata]|uniref:Uncharacterized protein n=1 Tax=Elysia crispata TaxID=231223 RepID=A0AAE0XVS6_9GAST|nr:hypothetical protein RRG08_020830 [Elysia crispata]